MSAAPRRWRAVVAGVLACSTLAVGAIRGLHLFDPYRAHRPVIEGLKAQLEKTPCDEAAIAKLVVELNAVGDSEWAVRYVDDLIPVPQCKYGLDFYGTAYTLHMTHKNGFAAATDATRMINLSSGTPLVVAYLMRAAAFRMAGREDAARQDEDKAALEGSASAQLEVDAE